MEAGVSVHLVCDAVSSQRRHDRAVAISRMQAAGVHLVTAESLLFDIMRTADHAHFKTISGLIKAHGGDSSAFAEDSTV